jgi:hypothetical protein
MCQLVFRPVLQTSPEGPLFFNNLENGGSLISHAATLGSTGVTGLVRNYGAAEGQVPFLLSQGEFISPVFDLIGSSFTRYRIKKLIFHYTPQATTVVEGRAVFAYADDPAHPILMKHLRQEESLLGSEIALTADPPLSSDLLILGDSFAFAPWVPWTMNVSKKVRQNELYTAIRTANNPPDANYKPNFTNDEVSGWCASQRESAFGAVGCSAFTTDAGPYVGGIIWIEASFEFIEFCPVVEGGVLSPLDLASTQFSRQMAFEKKLEEERKEKLKLALNQKSSNSAFAKSVLALNRARRKRENSSDHREDESTQLSAESMTPTSVLDGIQAAQDLEDKYRAAPATNGRRCSATEHPESAVEGDLFEGLTYTEMELLYRRALKRLALDHADMDVDVG